MCKKKITHAHYLNCALFLETLIGLGIIYFLLVVLLAFGYSFNHSLIYFFICYGMLGVIITDGPQLNNKLLGAGIVSDLSISPLGYLFEVS